MNVAVLGSGPAGLLAALAVEHAGHTPHIFAKGDKSPMFGAMYLHEPIPGLTGDLMAPDLEITVIKQGNRRAYAKNVYGDPDAPCSWDNIPSGNTPAWNLHKAYDALWDRYGPFITQIQIEASDIPSICNHYAKVFCTIPAWAICRKTTGHEFAHQDITIIHGPGDSLITGVNDNNLMYYNGETPVQDDLSDMIGFDWYRFSQINHYVAWEFSGRRPELGDDLYGSRKIAFGRKPLHTDCDCWLNWSTFLRLGRFGKWTKGVLTHHAYREAYDALH